MKSVTVISIFLASPSDVSEQRKLAIEAVQEYNESNFQSDIRLEILRWEMLAPQMGNGQQRINNHLLDKADLLIAVFDTNLGTSLDNESGTVAEIERSVNAGKECGIYFSNSDLPRNHDPKALRKLDVFKKKMQSQSLYRTYGNADGFKKSFLRDLPQYVNRFNTVGSNLPLISESLSYFDRFSHFVNTMTGRWITERAIYYPGQGEKLRSILKETAIGIDDLCAHRDTPTNMLGSIPVAGQLRLVASFPKGLNSTEFESAGDKVMEELKQLRAELPPSTR